MYKNIFILVLVIIIFMLSRALFAPISPPAVEILKIDTFEVTKDTTIYKPGKLIVKDTTIYDTIPLILPTDTLAILKDFFAKNVYKDTISFAEGSVSIVDTISQNQIFGRTYNAKITQKIIKETRELRIPYTPKASLYWGFMATKQGDLYGYGAGLMFKTANKGIFQLNYTNTKQVQLGYYSKIF